jgi:hypothetical protein
VSSRKIALLGAAAAVLLVVAGVALIAWLEGPARPTAAWPGGPDPASAAPAPPPGAPPATEAQAGEPPISPPRIGARPRAAASVAWEQVPAAARLSDLGPGLAAPVNAALRAARDAMDSCFEEETRLLASRPAPGYDPDAPPRGPAVLVLRLESRAGALDVVDTELESPGTSTRELVECARHVLKGWPVDAPAATAGQRYRLKYLLL